MSKKKKNKSNRKLGGLWVAARDAALVGWGATIRLIVVVAFVRVPYAVIVVIVDRDWLS
jgi:hypothetical protein